MNSHLLQLFAKGYQGKGMGFRVSKPTQSSAWAAHVLNTCAKGCWYCKNKR